MPPTLGPRTRLWDEELNCCLFDSTTDTRTVEQFLTDHAVLNFTIDHPPDFNWRTRRGGKVVKDEDGTVHWYTHRELAKRILIAEPTRRGSSPI